MESIIGNLFPVNSLFDVWLTKIVSLENEFETLNNRLNITGTLLEKLVDNISHINPKVFSDRELINEDLQTTDGNNPGNDFFEYRQGNNINDQQDKNGNDGGSEVWKGLKAFSKIAETTEKVLAVFGKLSPGIKKAVTLLKAASGISEGAEGIGGLVSFAGTGTVTAEGMTAGIEGIAIGGELLAGAAGIAEAGAVFGPPGWLTGAAALAAAGIISVVTTQDENARNKNTASEELQKKAIRTFEMSESDAATYISQAKQLPKVHQHIWASGYNPVKENIAKYGADAYSLNYQFPVPAIDNNQVQQNLPPWAKPRKEIIPVKQSYLEQTFDLKQVLYKAAITRGREGFNEAALHIITDAKNYDKIHHAHTEDKAASAISEELNSLLNDANEGRIISGDAKELPNRTSAYQNLNGRNAGNKTISINLNKPLIEHFTITVKDGKEGINDFKHKVEEALLEILNSANAIH